MTYLPTWIGMSRIQVGRYVAILLCFVPCDFDRTITYCFGLCQLQYLGT